MPTSPRYGFDYLESGETVPSDAVNEMVERIEAGGGHFIFKDRITDPSALTPAVGDTYLIDGTGAGDWTGHNNVIAYYLNTAWIYFTPIEGFTAWVNDVNEFIGFNGTTWDVIASPSGSYLPTTAVLDDLADVDAPTPADGDVLTWDNGASEWVAAAPAGGANPTESIIIACSDETTALTAGTAKVTFRMPYAFTLTAVRASVTTAPTGSVLTVDINEAGASILSTKLTIDASEKTSTTAATAAVISDSSLADDAEMTIDIDGVGSSVAGAGLKVYLIGNRT